MLYVVAVQWSIGTKLRRIECIDSVRPVCSNVIFAETPCQVDFLDSVAVSQNEMSSSFTSQMTDNVLVAGS